MNSCCPDNGSDSTRHHQDALSTASQRRTHNCVCSYLAHAIFKQKEGNCRASNNHDHSTLLQHRALQFPLADNTSLTQLSERWHCVGPETAQQSACQSTSSYYFTLLVLPSKSRENIPFGVAENRSVGQ